MDYTLAQYKPDTFELLAHTQTVDKLVSAFGYPPELYDLQFDWKYMMRGLIIDKVSLTQPLQSVCGGGWVGGCLCVCLCGVPAKYLEAATVCMQASPG
jgi:hypothetical protein